MEENNEIESVISTDIQKPDTIYQQDKAFIDTQIATAKQFPRNISRATENAVAIVTMDRETASTCVYSLPRGGKQITGASVHLAKILAQVWGNLRVEAKVINTDQRQITCQAVAFDLENNLAIKVEVKRSIVGKFGRFNDDMITMTGNAGNAIALRNAVLSVIPRAVVDKVLRSAKQTITGDISDANKLIARRKEVFDGFKETFEVTETEILSTIGKVSIKHVTSDDLVTLIGIGQAIRDGDTTVESVFRNKKDDKPEVGIEDLKKTFEVKKSLLSEAELKDAERIINNEEKLSYKKLINLLNSKNDKK
jgi:hypothetical protein